MCLPAVLLTALAAAPVFGSAAPVPAIVTTNRPTSGGDIRQFALDGDPATAFAAAGDVQADDHLTVTFDQPVALKAVTATTGRPDGTAALAAGVLEVSGDGTAFETLAGFASGKAVGDAGGKAVKAVRVRATAAVGHPLVVREFSIASTPPVAVFKYPVEIAVDTADAPELKEWAEKAARVCEREYPKICAELASDGFKPRTQIRMALRKDYNGVAAAGGGRITGSVKYFKAHPGDVGAMVHETVHCVQDYRRRGLPGWLVEGVADYYRFWRYEPGKAGRLAPERARYDGSYRVTAAFLAFAADKYDPKLVTKLNAALRAGTYKETIWKDLTGKPVEELNQEWRQTLAR